MARTDMKQKEISRRKLLTNGAVTIGGTLAAPGLAKFLLDGTPARAEVAHRYDPSTDPLCLNREMIQIAEGVSGSNEEKCDAIFRAVRSRVRVESAGNRFPRTARESWRCRSGDCSEVANAIIGMIRRAGIPTQQTGIEVLHLASGGATVDHGVAYADFNGTRVYFDAQRESPIRGTYPNSSSRVLLPGVAAAEVWHCECGDWFREIGGNRDQAITAYERADELCTQAGIQDPHVRGNLTTLLGRRLNEDMREGDQARTSGDNATCLERFRRALQTGSRMEELGGMPPNWSNPINQRIRACGGE